MPRQDKPREDYKPKNQAESFRQSLYGELTTPEALEAQIREREAAKKKGKFLGHQNFYFWLYAFTEKHFAKKPPKEYDMPLAVEEAPSKKKKKKKEPKALPKNYREAYDFMGWKVEDHVVMAMPTAAAVLAVIVGLLISGALYFYISAPVSIKPVCGDGYCDSLHEPAETKAGCPQDCDPQSDKFTNPSGLVREPPSAAGGPDIITLIILLFIPMILTATFVFYVQKYPLNAAISEKMSALTHVPEIMNYMVMQMRLKPNLERAVEFAAEHGEGRIAEEFRELLWKNQIGAYNSIEEGLDEMAYRWEPYSEEFKHAITLVRASVLLPSDAERNALYDKCITDLLDSTKEKMELYAHSMKQPSMYLFYIAILLPLMIIILLPVAAAFAKLPVASVEILAALYIVILPLMTYFYARSILMKRPGGYSPPDIPDNYPGLPRKGTSIIGGIKLPIVPVTIMIFIAILLAGYFTEVSLQVDPETARITKERTGEELAPMVLVQYYVPLSVASAIGFYLYAKSVNKCKIQEKIVKMELDFKDAMYLVASRLGEKKPLEDSLSYVKRFMPESMVATELLDNVQRNVMVLGLTLRSAIFDPTYGAMKHVPSRLMTSAFKIMTDSIELGPEVASTSLMSVSEQIRNVQKINELMKKLLDEITGMMSSMATFIGPIVLGMVSSLQGVISGVMEKMPSSGGAGSSASLAEASSRFGSDIIGKSDIATASPLQFQIVVAIYVMLLAIILLRFTGKVRYGNNKVAIYMTIGKSLPMAIAVFSASLYGGQMLLGGMT